MELKDITAASIKILSDRNVQELEHDILVDITHDLSLSAFPSDKYEIVKGERESRGLESLPPLNGSISWDDDYDD